LRWTTGGINDRSSFGDKLAFFFLDFTVGFNFIFFNSSEERLPICTLIGNPLANVSETNGIFDKLVTGFQKILAPL
jgi:hypothetical protein